MTDSSDNLITKENCRDIGVDITQDTRYTNKLLLTGKSTDQDQTWAKTGAGTGATFQNGGGKEAKGCVRLTCGPKMEGEPANEEKPIDEWPLEKAEVGIFLILDKRARKCFGSRAYKEIYM